MKPLLVSIALLMTGCSPKFVVSPGSHYHCSEALMKQVGELGGAVKESKEYLKRVELACGLHGNSKEAQ